MIRKNDFIWHIGFQGNTAVVNRRQRGAFSSADPGALLEAGMFRAAFCAAFWAAEMEKNAEAMPAYLELFAKKTGLRPSFDDMKRLMGVHQIPKGNLTVQAF